MPYDATRKCLLLAVLAVAAITDIKTGKIYNWLTYPAVLLGLGMAAWAEGWEGAGAAALGLLVGFLPMFIAFVIGGYGGGDAKLMAAVGALGLPDLALRTLVYGLLVGAAMACMVMVWRGEALATLRRVGAALGVILLGRKPADPTTANSPRVRLGVAIWLGGCWALWEEKAGTSAWDAIAGWLA